jgi:DNA polymerase III epsilon subunit-like protein
MGLFRRPASVSGGFAVVDVETTGLYPSTDRVVEM